MQFYTLNKCHYVDVNQRTFDHFNYPGADVFVHRTTCGCVCVSNVFDLFVAVYEPMESAQYHLHPAD